MKFKYLTLAFICLTIAISNAQNRKPIYAPNYTHSIKSLPDLFVGDTLPDFQIKKIINRKNASANTAEFKDQLLIIDFWATNCASCIEAFPHMEELQKKYGNKITILPVTYQPEKQIKEFWKNNRYTKNLNLPSVVEDSTFRTYFKNKGIPHEVWVYKGKVIGITAGSYVNSSNIDAILEGRKPNLPLKNDFYEFDPKAPLFTLDSLQTDPNKVSYSAVSGFRNGMTLEAGGYVTGIDRNQKNKTIRFYFTNGEIFRVYIGLLNQIKQSDPKSKPFPTFAFSKVLWEVADRSKYRYLPELGIWYDWAMANTICFESVQPDKGQSNADIYRSVLKDMDRLLGISVNWEKRKETVYVLKDQHGKAFKGGSINSNIATTVGGITGTWDTFEGNAFMFDETTVPDAIKNNYNSPKDKIDITEAEWKDFDALKKKLDKHGLDVVKEEREIDKIVFSEVRFKKSVRK